MLAPAKTGSGLSALVSARSADVLTVVVTAVLGLLPVLGSAAPRRPEAVLVTVVGPVALTSVATMRVNTCGPLPATTSGLVAMTVPVPPGAGILVTVQPTGAAKETKVVPPGTESVSTALGASEGPLLVKVML